MNKREIQIRGKTVVSNIGYQIMIYKECLSYLPESHVALVRNFYLSSISSFGHKGYPTAGGLAQFSKRAVFIREDCVNPSTIFHEVGHIVYEHEVRSVADSKFWWRKYKEAKDHKINWFGGSMANDREFFANAYAHYYLRRGYSHIAEKEIRDWFKEFDKRSKKIK